MKGDLRNYYASFEGEELLRRIAIDFKWLLLLELKVLQICRVEEKQLHAKLIIESFAIECVML